MFRKNYVLSIFFIACLSLPTYSQARRGGDNGPGNGGDAVVSDDGQVRFLDLVRDPETVMLDTESEGRPRPEFGVNFRRVSLRDRYRQGLFSIMMHRVQVSAA